MITVLLAAVLRVIRRETVYVAARHFAPRLLWPVGTAEHKPTYADFVITVLGRHALALSADAGVCQCVSLSERRRCCFGTKSPASCRQRLEPSVKLRRPVRRRLVVSWRSTAYTSREKAFGHKYGKHHQRWWGPFTERSSG